MKKRTLKTICCTVSALTITAVSAGAVLAAPVSGNNKCGGKNIAVADVENELLIRETASATGEVVGYLPKAAGMIVESMNEKWSKIRSGNISGYVKTDYLATGEEAEEFKNTYGVMGAVAAWDGVKVFSDYEDTSSIIGTLDEGEGFEVAGSTNNWVEVVLSDESIGYVALEDVEMTLVLDTAVSVDEYAGDTASDTQEEADTDQVVYESEQPVQEPVSEYTEYEAPQTEAYVAETEASYTDDSYTDDSYTDAGEDTTGTEDYSDASDDSQEEDNTGLEITDTTDTADTEGDTSDGEYYEEEGTYETEVIDETVTANEYNAALYDADTTVDNDGLTDDEYIDPETEAADDTASTASYSADDASLLAALIYCEAGNQSEEGKIAVGQVVMNRVESDSFANSVRDVIYESGQFTPAMSGWLDQVLASGETPSSCYDAAVAALNGEGTVGDALYFNGGSGQGQQIGDHQFY
ncbi:MAG: cell wall hydrolase [Eubacteriales bacterium]|nr:cell wall hydrolase [Eubacteriales bacterium]